MPKGMRNPKDDMLIGSEGGGGSGFGRFVDKAVPAATLAGMAGAGAKLADLKAKEIEKRKAEDKAEREAEAELKRESQRGMKKGGMVASKRADGIAQRGKTRGQMR